MQKATAFMKEATSSAKSICGRHLCSIYLFGGLAKGQFSKDMSDVDLLFIVTDDCPPEVVKELEHKLINLEIEYEFLKRNSWDKLLYIFALRTALFRSHFILRQGSLRSMNLYALFKEGRGFDFSFGRLLFPFAPAKLVIRNILSGRKILFGNDLIQTCNLPSPTFLDFHRSFIVALAISIFGVVASIIFCTGTFFSIEAIKWYILNIYAVLEHKIPDIRSATQYVVTKEPRFSSLVFRKFLELRENYSRDVIFSFISPLYLLYIHLTLSVKRA